MSMGGLHRGLSGLGAGLGGEQGGREEISQRRQDKSADCCRAHVVGLFEYFGQFETQPSWRFSQELQTNQGPKRHRSRFPCGVWP